MRRPRRHTCPCGHQPCCSRPTGLPTGWMSTIATNALLAWRPELQDFPWLGVTIAQGIRENA